MVGRISKPTWSNGDLKTMMVRDDSAEEEILIKTTCSRLIVWNNKEPIKGYEPAKGRKYLAYLYDLKPDWFLHYQETFLQPFILRGGLDLCRQLNGPYGRIILKAFLSKKQEAEATVFENQTAPQSYAQNEA